MIDSAELRPERTPPAHVQAVISGIIVGAFAFATVHAYRADALTSANAPTDGRASTWAIGLGVSSAAIAWYLDRGKAILPNIAHNKEVRARDELAIDTQRLHNEQARQGYRGVVRLTVEDQ